MHQTFFKYQSLGNDFVVFDWIDVSEQEILGEVKGADWVTLVRYLSNRHKGVGADCILVIKKTADLKNYEMLVFNADGSQAKNCLNGLRCVALHLARKRFVSGEFCVVVSDMNMFCLPDETQQSSKMAHVMTIIPPVDYQGSVSLKSNGITIKGYHVRTGNEHLIVHQETTLPWLTQYGKDLSKHSSFAQGINVSFIWSHAVAQDGLTVTYKMLIYENGCGITQACSSGVVAAVSALHQNGKINQHQTVSIEMLGGTVMACMNEKKEITLKAPAFFVFEGQLA